MNLKRIFYFKKFLNLIIFCLFIKKIISSFSLKYPHSLYLSNGNIFVIHKIGISIYDHLMTTKIKDILNFTQSEIINTGDLSKITITVEDEYIFSIIKDRIYIFNETGNLLYHNDTSILEENQITKYYSLTVFKNGNGIYRYIIAYKVKSNLYFIYFQYTISSKSNTCIYSYNRNYYEQYYVMKKVDYINYAISCQYMLYKNSNILTCFLMAYNNNLASYNQFYKMYALFFNVNDNGIYFNTSIYPKASYNNDTDIECIKSVLSPSRSRALVSLYRVSGKMMSFVFDIEYSSDFPDNRNVFFNNSYCMQNYFGLQIYYFKNNEESINSCLDTEGNLLIELYGENFNLYYYKKIAKHFLTMNQYSILYSNYTDKYFFISNDEPLSLLFGDNEEFLNIKNNYCNEDCINIDCSIIFQKEESDLKEDDFKIESEEELKEEDKEKESDKTEEYLQDKNEEEFDITEEKLKSIKKEELDKAEEEIEYKNEKELILREEELKNKKDEEVDIKEEETKNKIEELYKIEEELEIKDQKDEKLEFSIEKTEEEYNEKEEKSEIKEKNEENRNATNEIYKNFYGNHCPFDFPYEIIETQICVKECNISDISLNNCKLDNQNFTVDDNKIIQIVNGLRKNIKNGLMMEKISKILNGEDILFKDREKTISIITTQNQDNNQNINSTIIDLAECEFKLKEYYKIPKNESLIILQVEVKKEGLIPKVEYEVYYPLNNDKYEQLNLTLCYDSKIYISIPVEINEKDIDKYNKSSPFYNDICYTFTSEKGTDMCLKDRKEEFIENNMTLCEENCDLIEYDSFTKRAKCSCEAKLSIPLISEICIDKKRLYDSFTDIRNIANLEIMKCYYILFHKNGINNNYGVYISFFLLFLFSITIIIFYYNDNEEIINIINFLINTKKYMNNKMYIPISFKKKKLKKKANNKRKKRKYKRIKNIKKDKEENENYNNFSKINNSPPIKKIRNKKFKKKKHISMKPKIIDNNLNLSNENSNRAMIGHSNIITINPNLNKDIMKYSLYELNLLNYHEALKEDKRTYFQYYLSLIKTKHLLIFSFYQENNYNSRINKIFLFFFSFTIYTTINALFFNDSTMHNIYKSGGKFNFIYQIPQIIYSSLISSLLNTLLRNLCLSEKIVLEVKHENNIKILDKKRVSLPHLLRYKFIIFYIISFILLMSFGYYLSCFCAVFKNTQIHLLKDSIISFLISMIYPFGLFLLPGIFRIPSLRTQAKNKETMYKFSQIIQLI